MNYPVPMTPTDNKEPGKIKRLAGRYNMAANLFWSVLNFLPVSMFCYTLLSPDWIYSFLITSLLAMFLPKSFFDRIHLDRTTALYKKVGVNFINRLTQNGDIINVMIRKKYPDYKVVSLRANSVSNLIKQTYIFEKFHFILFIFFSLTTVYAVVNSFFIWAMIIAITNLFYNIYPILLQQYIRIKLKLAVRPK